MKKIVIFIFLLLFSNCCPQLFADEVKDKTDGSFVGSSFTGQDLRGQTDNSFVGTDTVMEQNSTFAGKSFDQDVKEGTNAPFAEESSNKEKDGVFIGQDIQQQTDKSFTNSSYGK